MKFISTKRSAGIQFAAFNYRSSSIQIICVQFRSSALPITRSQRSRAISRFPYVSPFLERHVYQQLVSFDLDYIAEGTFTAAGEIQTDTAAANVQIANAQLIQERRQRRIDDIQLFARRARAD